MKYLLFVGFSTGLLHNACHSTLAAVIESVKRLIEDEETKLENGKLPNVPELKEYLNKHDDYTGYLSNGTWFHIQSRNIFEIVK